MRSTGIGMAFVVLIAGYLFNGCSKKDYSGEIKNIDSLNVLITEAKKDFEMLDSGKISSYQNELRSLTDSVERTLSDSIRTEQAMLIDNYKELKKPFIYFLENRYAIIIELTYSQTQLNNLKQDLINNVVQKDSASKYYQTEISAAQNTFQSVTDITQSLNQYIPKFEEYTIRVTKLLETIKEDSLRLAKKK